MNEQAVRICAAISAGIGALVMIWSTVWGYHSLYAFFPNFSFGGINTADLLIQNFTAAYRLLGAVMVGVGLYRLLEVRR